MRGGEKNEGNKEWRYGGKEEGGMKGEEKEGRKEERR